MPKKIQISALALVVVITWIIPTRTGAQEQTDPSAKNTDVRKLMELTGAGKIGVQMADQMVGSFKQGAPQVPAEFWENFRKEINAEDLIELIVPIYAKYFSHEEVKNLIKFYETPLGKKLIDTQPDIMRESFSVGQKWGEGIAQRVIDQLQDEGFQIQ